MPAGQIQPRAGIVPGPFRPGPAYISSNLLEADVDPPTAPSWPMAREGGWAQLEGIANPTPFWGLFAGGAAGLEDLAIFEKIHVIPREADFGEVLSDQEIEAEVWNAYRSRDQLLTEITVVGPAGISVVDPYGQPVPFPATESRLYRVRALASGDPRIDNLVTWVFAGLDNSGSTLRLLGFRVLPWPFEADLQDPIAMTYGYLTDVISARTRKEQRIRLRSLAHGSIGFTTTVLDAREAEYANALLYGGLARPWGVPLWQFRRPLLSSAGAGQKTIPVRTGNNHFLAVDGLVMIWRSPWEWEVQRLAGVDEFSLATSLNLARSWARAGSWVMPMAIGRLSQRESFDWASLIAGSTRLVFQVEGFTV
jgi:hypothetical protein